MSTHHTDLMQGMPPGTRSFRVTVYTSNGGQYAVNLHSSAPSQDDLIEHLTRKLAATSGLLTWSGHDGGVVISTAAVVAVNVTPIR